MKTVLLLTVCAAGAVALAAQMKRGAGNESGEKSIVEEITQLERAFGEAITRRDAAWLAPYVADDFEATVPGGQVLTKQQALERVASPGYDLERLENRDIRVRVFGEVAIVSARGVARGKLQGQDVSAEFRYLRIWVQRNGRWQAVAAQSTLIESASKK